MRPMIYSQYTVEVRKSDSQIIFIAHRILRKTSPSAHPLLKDKCPTDMIHVEDEGISTIIDGNRKERILSQAISFLLRR